MTLVFMVPMPKNVANRDSGRSHWRIRHAEKMEYWATLDTLQNVGRLPEPPKKAFAKARIRSTMYLGGAMDDDNAVARHKVAIDWLKTRGYIKDDRKKCLTWERFPDQVVKRDGNYRILLVLTPEAG